MKTLFNYLTATCIVAAILAVPAVAEVILLENFDDPNGNGFLDEFPEAGFPWNIASGGLIPIVDGKAIFDPTENNNDVSIQIQQRYIPAPNFLHIPTFDSGMMIEMTGAYMDRGLGEDAEVFEFRFQSGNNEFYTPGVGKPIPPHTSSGSYWIGRDINASDGSDPDAFQTNTGVALPGSGETHWVRGRITAVATGVKITSEYSTDAGATYDLIGEDLVEDYALLNGTGLEDPGFFTQFLIIARGPKPDPNFGIADEGDFALDFLRIETLPVPAGIAGDMDCDGDVDFDDINDFVLGLNDAAAYQSLYGIPPSVKGDIDGDGDQDFDDISGFVGILSGGGAENVPEPMTLVLAVLGAMAVGWLRLRTSKG